MLRLDQAQANGYWEQGYHLFNEPVFSPERFDRLKEIFESLYAARGDSPDDSLDTPHFQHPELLDFLLADDVLDLVEPLLGPDIGLWSSHFIAKEPWVGLATPWHEDSSYWNGRFDSFSGIVTIWLAIDPADAENGAMKVVSGTHKIEGYAYEPVDPEVYIFDSQIVGVDNDQAVTFLLKPNECSLHDSRIVHGADTNKSPRRRCGYTMRYFSQQMKLNLDHPGNRDFKIWHARGDNPHGNPMEN